MCLQRPQRDRNISSHQMDYSGMLHSKKHQHADWQTTKKEILSPHCCQFQFISGKCHLLILITTHKSREVNLWTTAISERAKVMSVINWIQKFTASWWRLGEPSPLVQRLPRAQRVKETDRKEISLNKNTLGLHHLDTQPQPNHVRTSPGPHRMLPSDWLPAR